MRDHWLGDRGDLWTHNWMRHDYRLRGLRNRRTDLLDRMWLLYRLLWWWIRLIR